MTASPVAPIDTPTATIWLEDGIVRVEIKDGARVKLADAQEHVAAVRGLCRDQRRPMLTDISRVASTSREARIAYRDDDAEPAVIAQAIVTGSPISGVIASFFVRLSRPRFPTRVFSDKQAALDWLRSQR